MKRAYKTEIDPNNVQRTLLLKSAGTARFAYNWGLDRKREIYLLNQLPGVHIKTPSAIDLNHELIVRFVLNLSKLAVSSTDSINACLRRERPPMIQELNSTGKFQGTDN